jgi:polyisoprenoid-binding protein YceI
LAADAQRAPDFSVPAEPAAAAAPIEKAPIAEPPPTATPAARAAGQPTAFLSFTLPSSQFRFDAEQEYVIVPELSRVGFDAKSTLHDFTGVTSSVAGRFRADFDDPAGAWTGAVTASAATLKTGVDGRDANMREHLAIAEHKDIRFAIERFKAAASGIDVANQRAKGEVFGQMTIRGQTRPFALPVAIEVDAQKRVVITGQAPLKLSDYGVPVPSQLGVISMQDEVVVWIALRARRQGGGSR